MKGPSMQVVNVHGPGDVRLDDVAPPQAGEYDAIIRIDACGICGTDLAYIREGGLPHVPSPMPIGHEAAGTVLAVGPKVNQINVGQRVLVNPMGSSAVIGNGGPEGAFTQQLLVRDAERSLLIVPQEVPSDVAALAEPLAVAQHGVNRSEAKAGEKVAVFGCGPIGLGAVLWLADRGVTDIVAIDVHEERLKLAMTMGARATIHADREDIAARLGELHGSQDLFGRQVVLTNVYIDAAGAPTIVPDVVARANSHARLVIIAAYREPVSLDLSRMLMSEMTIKTSMGYPDELKNVLESLPRLMDKLQHFVSHRLPFDAVIEGFRIAAQPDSAKVMIQFSDAI